MAATVTIDEPDMVRQAMGKLRAPGEPVLHWHDEKPERRDEIIGRLAELNVHAFAVSCHPAAKRQERARSKLLTAMVHDLTGEGVDRLVIEARQEALNKRDRITLEAAKRSGHAPGLVSYSHVGKRSEPLLWVADVVAGVVSLHLAGDDSSYYARLQPSLLVIRQLDPEP